MANKLKKKNIILMNFFSSFVNIPLNIHIHLYLSLTIKPEREKESWGRNRHWSKTGY